MNFQRTITLPLDLLVTAAALGQVVDSPGGEQPTDTVTTMSATQAVDSSVEASATVAPVGSGGHAPFFSLPTYRISIGASFDFIERFKANNVYGDLIIDLPEVLRTKKAVCGFLGGLYQVRSVTVDSFIPEQVYLISTTPLPDFEDGVGGDSIIVHASAAGGVKRSVTDNRSIFVTLYRPWYLADGTPGSSGLYHLFYLGLLNRREQITETYTSTGDGEVYLGTDTDLPPLPMDRQYTENRNDVILGFGQMLRHEFDDLALQFYGVATCMPDPWRGGYLMSFNAIGSRSGLIAGAEIRLDALDGAQQYNIFLAKTFKLAEMTKLITSY